MTAVRGIRACGAFALLLLVPQLSPAAWDNVFQVTCFGCKRPPQTAAYYAPPCTSCQAPCPCPAPCACPTTTAYVQRTYYQPVVSYQAETHYEPVTSYRTSYYYEPVTSYTYSSYYDPCGCSCHQVATPVTSYRMRSQCNAVVNYVARVSYRPVTSYRQSCYMEAVQVPACPTAPSCPTCQPAPVAAGVVIPQPAGTSPPLNLPSDPNAGASTPPPPALKEQREYYTPPASQSGRPISTPVAPAFKPERVASLSGSPVNGQVVRNDFAPRPGARVVFVNSQRQDVRTTADAAGRFQVNLASGNWYVYVSDSTGGLTYHNQLTVRGGDAPVTVVSR